MEGDVDLAEVTGSIVNKDTSYSTKDAVPRRVDDGVDNDVDDEKHGFDEGVNVDVHNENDGVGDGVATDDEDDDFNDGVENENDDCIEDSYDNANDDVNYEKDEVDDSVDNGVEYEIDGFDDGTNDENDNPFPHPSFNCDDFECALVKTRLKKDSFIQRHLLLWKQLLFHFSYLPFLVFPFFSLFPSF